MVQMLKASRETAKIAGSTPLLVKTTQRSTTPTRNTLTMRPIIGRTTRTEGRPDLKWPTGAIRMRILPSAPLLP